MLFVDDEQKEIFEHILALVTLWQKDDGAIKIKIREVKLPQQPNLWVEMSSCVFHNCLLLIASNTPFVPPSNDCGLYYVKYLQMWTGETNDAWGGLTMPVFTEVRWCSACYGFRIVI